MNNIYCLVGKSGSGKSTIAEQLSRQYHLDVLQSYTTRPPRSKNERGHIFLTEAEFDRLQNLCAYTKFNGYRYGVTADLIDKSDIYVIDPAGILYMKNRYYGKKIVAFYLDVPDNVLIQRMRNRGDDESAIQSRMAHDAIAFQIAPDVCDIVLPYYNGKTVAEYAEEIRSYMDQFEAFGNTMLKELGIVLDKDMLVAKMSIAPGQVGFDITWQHNGIEEKVAEIKKTYDGTPSVKTLLEPEPEKPVKEEKKKAAIPDTRSFGTPEEESFGFSEEGDGTFSFE